MLAQTSILTIMNKRRSMASIGCWRLHVIFRRRCYGLGRLVTFRRIRWRRRRI